MKYPLSIIALLTFLSCKQKPVSGFLEMKFSVPEHYASVMSPVIGGNGGFALTQQYYPETYWIVLRNHEKEVRVSKEDFDSLKEGDSTTFE